MEFGREVGSTVEGLVKEFEISWKPETGRYSTMFVEFCSAKAMVQMYRNLEEGIASGSFSRLSFDMMLAWETPSSEDEESREVRIHMRSSIRSTILCISSILGSYLLVLSI